MGTRIDKNEVLTTLLKMGTNGTMEDALLHFLFTTKDVSLSTVEDSEQILNMLRELTMDEVVCSLDNKMTGGEVLTALSALSDSKLARIFKDVGVFREHAYYATPLEVRSLMGAFDSMSIENFLIRYDTKRLCDLPNGAAIVSELNSSMCHELMQDDNADNEVVQSVLYPTVTGATALELIEGLNGRVKNKVLYDNKNLADMVKSSIDKLADDARDSTLLKYLSYIPGLGWIRPFLEFSGITAAVYGLVLVVCYFNDELWAIDIINTLLGLF